MFARTVQNLAYIHRPHRTGAHSLLFCCMFLSRDDVFFSHCDSASSEREPVVLPPNVFTDLARKGSLTRSIYGLIPRMRAISLTTLQHI